MAKITPYLVNCTIPLVNGISKRKNGKMSIENKTDIGIAIIRIGLGIMFITAHGWRKLIGGPETWEKLGSSMSRFGIESFHEVFGFLAAFAETFGALFLLLGLFHRWGTVLLFLTMLVAASKHIIDGDGFGRASHAIEAAIVFAGLFITGPGRFSLDRKFFGR